MKGIQKDHAITVSRKMKRITMSQRSVKGNEGYSSGGGVPERKMPSALMHVFQAVRCSVPYRASIGSFLKPVLPALLVPAT
jgi:hypothetical protein